jgi:hypothetical protein
MWPSLMVDMAPSPYSEIILDLSYGGSYLKVSCDGREMRRHQLVLKVRSTCGKRFVKRTTKVFMV